MVENVNEEWRDVRDYVGDYQVSNHGNVRSFKSEITKQLKAIMNKQTGYLFVSLFKNGKGKAYTIHRLVAEAFLPNPENKPEVDHINTIRTDNYVGNLRWVSGKENSNNPLSREHNSNAKKGSVLSEETKRKLSETQKGRKHSTEHVRKIADSNRGRVRNEEARKNIANAHWSKKPCDDIKKKISDASKNRKYAPRSEEHKQRIAEAHAKPITQYTISGVFLKTWKSMAEIQRCLGIHQSNITKCCYGKRKTAGGYIWEFADNK